MACLVAFSPLSANAAKKQKKPRKPQTELWPDGTKMDAWFSNAQKVNIDTLGKKYILTNYGVKTDSTLIQTKAIQAIIDRAAQDGGGVIVVPAGTYQSGALFFRPKTHLYLEEGGKLKGSDRIANFPVVETRIEGETCKYFSAFINADKCNGFTIAGPGTIDGNGYHYWEEFWIRRTWNRQCTNKDAQRPRLVYISNSSNVTLQDVHIQNSPFWTNHIYRCDHVRFLGCTIFAPTSGMKAPSSDAIDIDVCHDVLVDGCEMSVNDDAIAIKGGKGTWADQAPENGPNNYAGSGEWYFKDSSRENGITLNSDGMKQWSCEAGYHKVTFDYKASPMTLSIEKVESLELSVNGTAMTYAGNNEYTATLNFTKGEPVTFAGCNDLEYVRQDPDFLKDGKFNSKTGTYTVVLRLGTRENSWSDSGNQIPNNSWTIFRSENNGGVYSTIFLSGEGVASVTIKNCVGWNVEGTALAFMAEIGDKAYQFTGRYRDEWWKLEPYDRWANDLNFKYFGNIWWNGGIVSGVNLNDKTGKITQGTDGNLRWADAKSKWDDYGTYRMTVDMNTNPQTVTFEKL